MWIQPAQYLSWKNYLSPITLIFMRKPCFSWAVSCQCLSAERVLKPHFCPMWGSFNEVLGLETTHWSAEIFSGLHGGQRLLPPHLPPPLTGWACTAAQGSPAAPSLFILHMCLPSLTPPSSQHLASDPLLASVSWRV